MLDPNSISAQPPRASLSHRGDSHRSRLSESKTQRKSSFDERKNDLMELEDVASQANLEKYYKTLQFFRDQEDQNPYLKLRTSKTDMPHRNQSTLLKGAASLEIAVDEESSPHDVTSFSNNGASVMLPYNRTSQEVNWIDNLLQVSTSSYPLPQQDERHVRRSQTITKNGPAGSHLHSKSPDLPSNPSLIFSRSNTNTMDAPKTPPEGRDREPRLIHLSINDVDSITETRQHEVIGLRSQNNSTSHQYSNVEQPGSPPPIDELSIQYADPSFDLRRERQVSIRSAKPRCMKQSTQALSKYRNLEDIPSPTVTENQLFKKMSGDDVSSKKNWRSQKAGMALQHFKQECKNQSRLLKNTQVFLNMVIHDLRNPTNQINFAISYALDKLAQVEQASRDNQESIRRQLVEAIDQISSLEDRSKDQGQNKKCLKNIVEESRAQIDALKKQLADKEAQIQRLTAENQQHILTLQSMGVQFGHYKNSPAVAGISNLADDESDSSSLDLECNVPVSTHHSFTLEMNLQRMQADEEQTLSKKYQSLNPNTSKFFESQHDLSDILLDDSLNVSRNLFKASHQTLPNSFSLVKPDDRLEEVQAKLHNIHRQLALGEEANARERDEARKMIESCQHSSIMLLTLINDLLDLAKTQKLTFELNRDYFSLIDSVQKAFKTLEFMAKQKEISTKLVVAPGQEASFERIFGDSNRYEQILLNFISNALKFTKASGSVQIELQPSIYTYQELQAKKPEAVKQLAPMLPILDFDSSVKVNVFKMLIIDNGQGISQDGLKNLFIDFSSLQEHKQANQRGTGLGLSICKRIIQSMGGSVSVESELGKGTTFVIEIPTIFRDAAEESLRTSLSSSELESLEGSGDQFVLNTMTTNQRSGSGYQKRFLTSAKNDKSSSSNQEVTFKQNQLSQSTFSKIDSHINEVGPQEEEIVCLKRCVKQATVNELLKLNNLGSDEETPTNSHQKGLSSGGLSRNSLQQITPNFRSASHNYDNYFEPFSKEITSKLKVLLVNDEPSVLFMMEAMLKSNLGISQLSKAANGQEAVDAVKLSLQAGPPIDLILMDLNMPVMDGAEAARQIGGLFAKKEKRPYLVAVSASEISLDLRIKCQVDGFDDAFCQPLTGDIIEDQILAKMF